jgi:Na+-driven multidrug efflux pump
MLKPAVKYLTYRSFGAPAVLLSLAMQGIFRGFKDTTTPLYVIGMIFPCFFFFFFQKIKYTNNFNRRKLKQLCVWIYKVHN